MGGQGVLNGDRVNFVGLGYFLRECRMIVIGYSGVDKSDLARRSMLYIDLDYDRKRTNDGYKIYTRLAVYC